ncbi:hypothetical protein BCON_0257g00020 [Botryotinia convoluta]|uniref:Carboxylesterase type B domain-containing protein n=1 Tax=Botryotinia convoluta TaxID=54673 RepID=A0A4Z1HMI7_9HELO|nr:hypothetical protein BCON_0257g00020 [Botryotinia convoluta]
MVPITVFDKVAKAELCDDEPGAPVLVWIDGGSFTGGYKHETNPVGLTENSIVLGEEFVYVSINYRLGLYVNYVANLKWLFLRAPELLIYDIFALYPDQFDGKYGYTSEMLRAAVTSVESCFACNTRYLNDKVGNKSYVYSFNVPPALHADDVAYTFYNGPGSVTWDGKPVFGDAALSLQDYILNFVTTGTPNGRRVPDFALYDSESNVLSINSSFGTYMC